MILLLIELLSFCTMEHIRTPAPNCMMIMVDCMMEVTDNGTFKYDMSKLQSCKDFMEGSYKETSF